MACGSTCGNPILSLPDPDTLSAMIAAGEGPRFAEPWQAEAFALTLALHRAGAFAWGEWADAFAARRLAAPDPDAARYFDDWLDTLEALVAARAIVGAGDLARRKAQWTQAYESTPHGHPVELPAEMRDRAIQKT